MNQHYGWFEAFKNEDGTISAAIPKEWPQDVKDNFEKSVDLWVARGSEIERERVIKLLEVLNTCDCDPDDGQAKHYRCGATQGLTPNEVVALIKGENK